jgi:hypothetical protein
MRAPERLPGSSCLTFSCLHSTAPTKIHLLARLPAHRPGRSAKKAVFVTHGQAAVEVPRLCPTECRYTWPRIARFGLVMMPSLPPQEAIGLDDARRLSSYKLLTPFDAVCLTPSLRPCRLPVAGLVPSFLPNIFLIMEARPLPRFLALSSPSLSPVCRGTGGHSLSQPPKLFEMPDC